MKVILCTVDTLKLRLIHYHMGRLGYCCFIVIFLPMDGSFINIIYLMYFDSDGTHGVLCTTRYFVTRLISFSMFYLIIFIMHLECECLVVVL